MINEIEPSHWTFYQDGQGRSRILMDDTDAINLPLGDTYVMCARIVEGILEVRAPRSFLSPLHYWLLIKLLRRSRKRLRPLWERIDQGGNDE